MARIALLIWVILALIILAIRIVMGIQTTQNCTGHLRLAATASTIEIAKSELDIAIKYLETQNITKGYTSILWKTPGDDIGFWYNNLKSSRDDLNIITDSSTYMERSNILLKLRETLMENTTEGDKVVVPQGLARYPHNGLWAILTTFAVIGILVGFAVITDRS